MSGRGVVKLDLPGRVKITCHGDCNTLKLFDQNSGERIPLRVTEMQLDPFTQDRIMVAHFSIYVDRLELGDVALEVDEIELWPPRPDGTRDVFRRVSEESA